MPHGQALMGYLDCTAKPGKDKVGADRDKPNIMPLGIAL
jgi:hypothetical protein